MYYKTVCRLYTLWDKTTYTMRDYTPLVLVSSSVSVCVMNVVDVKYVLRGSLLQKRSQQQIRNK